MRFLFIARQKKNVDAFKDVLVRLLNRGHAVTVAIQEQVEQGRFGDERLEFARCPEGRGDEWRTSAPLVRSVRDWTQYLRPEYARASKLRARAAHRLAKELGAEEGPGGDLALPPAQALRLRQTLERVELSIPSDPLHEEFIRRHDPDVVVVTPGLHFGSAQADFMKSARAVGVPVWMLVFSWDNLSTKGAIHVAPDLMFVWNERQRREAGELHDFPAAKVIPVGAPRFDEFFALSSAVPRKEFMRPLGLDPDAPALLYLCSSRFIAERELPFVSQWLSALRNSSDERLRRCSVIVRPHPDIALVEDTDAPEAITWPGMPPATGWIQRPFADASAIVLRTAYRTQQAFYECLHHAAAVVGLNTSAELEAGIAGRPVFTLLVTQEGADGQSNTLHFNYLLRDHGGFVTYAPDLATHVVQLGNALEHPQDTADIRQFIQAFLRPHGESPVADVLAQALEDAAPPGRSHDEARGSSRPVQESQTLSTAPPDDDVGVPEEPRKKVALGYPGSSARVLASPETRRMRRKGVLVLDDATVAWLGAHVHPGETLYDIGAGIGAYSIAAALHRGAAVVAFEPGFGTFKRLCDNLLLNGCYRSIAPLPIALGDRTGLLELEYRGEAGGHGHTLSTREWRTSRDTIAEHYTQPVCAERLDDVVTRYGLARPHALRVAMRRGAVVALRGADVILRDPQLRSVLAAVKGRGEAEAVAGALEAYGFSATITPGAGSHRTVTLVRQAGRAAADAPQGLLSRVAARMRSPN